MRNVKLFNFVIQVNGFKKHFVHFDIKDKIEFIIY